ANLAASVGPDSTAAAAVSQRTPVWLVLLGMLAVPAPAIAKGAQPIPMRTAPAARLARLTTSPTL
ncbi:hypothetical protein FRC11_014207, partial [Ceratobasidium sp. 423]